MVNEAESVSYADAAKKDATRKQVNFRCLDNAEKHEGLDVVIPKEFVKRVQSKMAFILYGYFLGDRLAYPVVEYFV